MRIGSIIFSLFISTFIFSQIKSKIKKPEGEIIIQYADSLPGNFEFNKDWSYSSGIYKNKNGQILCEGICPMEAESMKDEFGNIYKDSLKAYYKMIDTTHYYHTLQSEAWTYDYEGVNFINCFKNSGGFYNCYSPSGGKTQSSLRLSINGDKCYPSIFIAARFGNSGNKIFKCDSGFIIIDSKLLAAGILKAEFDFKFINTTEPAKKMYWKGKIYTPIIEF